MSTFEVTKDLRKELVGFFEDNRKADLVNTFLFFIEKQQRIRPVVFPPGKLIYKSARDATTKLEAGGKIWKEAEIKIGIGEPTVNELTRKIYICPYTGKVFADNTHPNPQDAIYDWVSNCKENTDRKGGLRKKRFFVSEDPEVIRGYIQERKKPVVKVVYSSVASGKLFHSKEAVVEDFKTHYLREIPLEEVPNQNRFEIEEELLDLIQDSLQEEQLAGFVEALAEFEEFVPFVQQWVEGEEEESEESVQNG